MGEPVTWCRCIDEVGDNPACQLHPNKARDDEYFLDRLSEDGGSYIVYKRKDGDTDKFSSNWVRLVEFERFKELAGLFQLMLDPENQHPQIDIEQAWATFRRLTK